MPLITVTGKDDLGYSPKYGPIVKGQRYDIEAEDFSAELFERTTTKKAPEAPAEGGI